MNRKSAFLCAENMLKSQKTANCQNMKTLILIIQIFFLAKVWCYRVAEWGSTPGDPGGAPRHMCDRVCRKGQPPMTCRYDFVIELYTTRGRVNTFLSFQAENKMVFYNFISVNVNFLMKKSQAVAIIMFGFMKQLYIQLPLHQ